MRFIFLVDQKQNANFKLESVCVRATGFLPTKVLIRLSLVACRLSLVVCRISLAACRLPLAACRLPPTLHSPPPIVVLHF
jgi:hypothetical protein